jgi:tetratricopeptide (TPR) repeat protein
MTAEDYFRDAVRLRNNRDYTAAIQALDHALEIRPNWLPAVASRADNLYNAKRYDEAIAAFDRAIQIDPKRAASYDGRGLALSYSGKQDQAIPDYSRAVELLPGFANAYNNRGWAYMETGHLEEALGDFNKAIELNPAYTTALFNRAHLFEKRKEYAKAIADYDGVLHVNPTDAAAARQKDADLRNLEGNAAPTHSSLEAPKPLSPEDRAVFEHYPRETTVVWAAVSSAAGYMVEWDFKDNQGWNYDRNGIAMTVHAIEPVATFRFVGAQPGRWRVWAVDSSGAAGPKSEWREFRYTQ